jgi:hypothetical protein
MASASSASAAVVKHGSQLVQIESQTAPQQSIIIYHNNMLHKLLVYTPSLMALHLQLFPYTKTII